MPAIDPNTLLEEAECYACLGISLSQGMKLALLSRTLKASVPEADTSAEALAEYSKCYTCFGASLYDTLVIALLDQISQA